MQPPPAFTSFSPFSCAGPLGFPNVANVLAPPHVTHEGTTNSLVLHAEEQGHLPRWENRTALHTEMEKRKRKLVEAAYIATSLVTNHREGFVSLAYLVQQPNSR